MKPHEVREQMTRGLQRRLIGPLTNTPDETSWPGEYVEQKIVDDKFAEPKTYPTGPWVGPNGEEVLPDPPKNTYLVGTLGPSMLMSAMDQGKEVDQNVLDEAEKDIQAGGEFGNVDVSDTEGDGDADEDVEVSVDKELGSAQESIGISIRVDNDVESIDVCLRGGAYKEISVAQSNRAWWIRRDVMFGIKLSAKESSSQDFSDGDIEVQIGIDVRTDETDTKVCTIWARNRGADVSTFVEATRKTLFQVRLTADLTKKPKPYAPFTHHSASSLDLLYQTITLFSIGHGCDSKVERFEDIYRVSSVSMPIVNVSGLTPDIKKDGLKYAVGMNDLGDMNSDAVAAIERILFDYESWIILRRGEIPEIDAALQQIASEHIDECERFLSDMKDGWQLIHSNADISRCLRDASKAMSLQRIGSGASLRAVSFAEDGSLSISGENPHTKTSDQSEWRPFQIAFILASLRKMTDENAVNKSEVDVIWMPTGGGKTEAYLGLAAFTILWEKLHQTRNGKDSIQSTKVLMRYTLRLLTVQQIQRATSLICALELTRRKFQDVYGNAEVRIGAWLGNKVTPGTRKDAVSNFKASLKSGNDYPSITKKCPWCGTQMGHVHKQQVAGFKMTLIPQLKTHRILTFCPDSTCPFSAHSVVGPSGATIERGIPIFEADQDVYTSRPDFVVGTVDKMARISWRTESQALFGLAGGKRTYDPPRLFIQDELHLIAGPLGSIDGVFEVMLEHLCEIEGGRAPVLVAATATTKNYRDQVHALYARSARVIPPPGLTIDDSFFAEKDPNSQGKTYVGICSGGHSGATNLQTNVLSVLSHQPPALESAGANPDPYWTNITFFSSRRSLGLLTSAVETTLKSRLNYMNALTGLRTGDPVPGKVRRATRFIRSVRELTATSSEDVSRVLADLEISKSEEKCVDLCFATSMIEVGLDVPRLGLMTVMGQPKSASQYIQVTGRVGRHHSAPGLVVTVLNSRIARDRAHYEGFSAWHDRLYASVESASVTPFTTRALEKSAPSVLTAMLRIIGNCKHPSQDIAAYWSTASNVLAARANKVGGSSSKHLATVLHALGLIANRPEVAKMKWTTEEDGKEEPFTFAMGSTTSAVTRPHWRILNSMRSVDQDANMKAFPGGNPAPPAAPTNPPTDGPIDL
jgi:hypothetical protein